MTDPKESVRKGQVLKNISVQRLPDYLTDEIQDVELLDRIDKAKNAAAFARNMRDKKIAHMDFDSRIGANPVSTHSRKSINEALDAIAACVRRFAHVEMKVSLSTHLIEPDAKDEVGFLITLYRGLSENQRLREERIRVYKEEGWQAGHAFDTLPEWLTFRPAPIIDAE